MNKTVFITGGSRGIGACAVKKFAELGYNVAFTYLNVKDEEEANAQTGDHEGIVDIGRDIEGVQVSIFIREREDLNGYKVSLRSNGDINVADLCFLFGGGGHKNAAGCSLSGTLTDVKQQVLDVVKQALEELDAGTFNNK